MYQFSQLEPYFESLPGLMIIDMQGKTLYMNLQCAEYFGIDRDETIGKDIRDYFPETAMIDNLDIEEPRLAFYNSHLGIGISVNFPVYDASGKKIGLGEYDVVQRSEILYDLADDYRDFLNDALDGKSIRLKTYDRTRYTINDLLGKSLPMEILRKKILSAAITNSTVMITGETGTGKELVAHAIHNLSNRRKERFIKINAASLPENLIEAELFGYEKGSFTGALNEGKKGKFELADKGTLFIDEINQMPMSVQPKLLRALQEREIDRIGGQEPIPVDVRIITASNENLDKLVRQGRFREDLYYRLKVIEIKTPPLREHIEDMEEIVHSMIQELNVENGRSILGVDEEALEELKRRYWKGNIRELRNVIESAMAFARDDMLHKKDLDPDQTESDIDIQNLRTRGSIIEQARDDAEREVIRRVLKKFDGNKSRTAKYLGIARPLLYQKMKRLGLDR